MPAPQSSIDVEDVLLDLGGGMNSDAQPLLLEKNQASFITNGTVRGSFLTDRPKYRKMDLDFGGDATLQTNMEDGFWQGAGYYRPDQGLQSLLASISGRLFEFIISGTDATVFDRSIVGDLNPANRTQVWIFQAEKWAIINDGISRPLFFDRAAIPTTRRSISAQLQQVTQNGVLDLPLTIAVPIGGSVTITLDTPFTGASGDIVQVGNTAQFLVTASGGNTVTGDNLNVVGRTFSPIQSAPGDSTNAGTSFPKGTPVTYWTPTTTLGELPPGRMGAYGMGRVAMSLVDGKQFIIGDIVGGQSGTVAENFRDAVLKISENSYLAGGGNFTVPGSMGDINYMRFTARVDASLGQGPLLVGTRTGVFTCNAPVNRLEWQDMQNPILSQSLLAYGGLGQNSTINVNGDIFFRALDGIRSLQDGRKDFNQPGNVPQSIEMERVIRQDDTALLQYSSAIVFDNRLFMTAKPTEHEQGVFHRGLIAMNLDPISSLRGKAPPVYDGLHTGLQVLQLVLGEFEGVERAFAFCLNTAENKIELWEILKDQESFFDEGTLPVRWGFESPAILANVPKKTLFDQVRLLDGEMYIDDVRGRVDVRVQYKPESYPCWRPWKTFSICAPVPTSDPNAKPGFRSRIGFGEPSPTDCEPTNNRPFREAHWFQLRFTFQGHMRLLGLRFRGVLVPMPRYALPAGCCPTEIVVPAIPRVIDCTIDGLANESPLPMGTVGVAYSVYLHVADMVRPLTYEITDGELPDGLTLDATTGIVYGTPTEAVVSEIIVTVTDANGDTCDKAFTLQIITAEQGFILEEASPPILDEGGGQGLLLE